MTILIAVAMKMEINYLFKKFTDFSEYQLGEYKYYQTKVDNKTIYILLTGVGSLNTAISLTKFLHIIKPDVIINAGTAGAHDKKLNVGDIVLAKEVINTNSIDTVFKEENEGSNSLNWKLKAFSEDAEDKGFIEDILIYYGNEKLISSMKTIGEKYGFKIYEGRVSSGDVWNKEKDRIKYFNEKYGSFCEEMEIYSIYKICKQEKIPCLGVKIISNNEMNGQPYERNISEKLDEFLYKILLDYQN